FISLHFYSATCKSNTTSSPGDNSNSSAPTCAISSFTSYIQYLPSSSSFSMPSIAVMNPSSSSISKFSSNTSIKIAPSSTSTFSSACTSSPSSSEIVILTCSSSFASDCLLLSSDYVSLLVDSPLLVFPSSSEQPIKMNTTTIKGLSNCIYFFIINSSLL